jgi:hypothetical protein
MNYKEKYLKYKKKYLDLKMNMSGGVYPLNIYIKNLTQYIDQNTSTNVKDARVHLTNLIKIRDLSSIDKQVSVSYDYPIYETKRVIDQELLNKNINKYKPYLVNAQYFIISNIEKRQPEEYYNGWYR